ncbi:MAG: 50S ribosomal protein L10, partial [Acidimicrobiia bacterium]|nr:50S ribosomal protein L10 [Acidimicrobiia bacterium]
MSDPRPEKVAIVTEVKERLEQSSSVLVTEYRGLSVKALADLRRSLRPAGGAYKVYKNTLVRRAASEAGVDLEDHLVGPTALTFTETTPEGEAGDIVSIAKVLKEFARTNPDLVIKGGLLDGEPLDAAGVGRLADLEPREVLLARLAGLIAAPMQQLAGLLQAIPRDFAYGLQALIDKGGAAEDAQADVSPAAEDAAAVDVSPAAEDAAAVDVSPAAEDAAA